MQQIYQPDRSRLCGQTCVAMIAGVDLPESIRIFGHRKGTTVAGLVRALRRLHIGSDDFLRLVDEDTVFPMTYIAQVKYPRRRKWHWVLFHDGAMFDPSRSSRPDGRINAILTIYLDAQRRVA